METIVTIEIEELPIPEHWHTAQECRERAESWENSEIKSCLEIIITHLWEVAGEGGTEAVQEIRTGRPAHFYKTLRSTMESLGYRVESPIDPRDNTHCFSKPWTFKW